MKQETLDLLALSLVPGLGTVRIRKLLETGRTPGEILSLGRKALRRLRLSEEVQAYLLRGVARAEAEKTAKRCQELHVSLVAFADEVFPEQLRQIYDPPLVLYSRGNLNLLKGPSVAVVGSRNASVYGRQVARRYARELASYGLVIVSGLARGIDSMAHLGALDAQGNTLAVLGTGIDVVYPRENRQLFQRIAEEGCLLAEFPLETFPAPQNFPIRNRIISGLCLGTLIPEASEFSGSLITARLTLEQNRELWAVPGNITNPGSYGPNYLIKQGAKPILSARELLDDLPHAVVLKLKQKVEPESKGALRPEPIGSDLSAEETGVLARIPTDRPVHLDQLAGLCGSSAQSLYPYLLNLEMKGLVQHLSGRRYVRKL